MSKSIRVQVVINGEEVCSEVPSDLSLLHYLRNWMGLTGAKNGCSKGHCGSCTVIVNGKARRSCLVKMSRIQGAHIETIEGLAKEGQLHPLQQCFIEQNAIQCGFCTTGMIMTAKALLDANPSPTDEEIKIALTKGHNLCRCTGYVNIIDAIQTAAITIREGHLPTAQNEKKKQTEYILLPQDSIDIVTGNRKYGDDIDEEGMLYGKILWSEYPHAEVLNIDTEKAKGVDGVICVLTHKDIPGLNQAGLLIRDQPALAADRVRNIGDPLAVVYAKNIGIAEKAIRLIKVEYKALAGVFTPEDAARSDAPIIHSESNLAKKLSIVRGDVDKAFKECSVIVENKFTTSWIEHGYLEPESGVAYPTPDGGVMLKIGTQNAFGDQEQLSEILGLPKEKIRVTQLPVGGAFGAKEDLLLHQHLALGAIHTGKPVKLVLTREESMRVHVKKHPSWMRYKVGADDEGHLLAVQAEITIDTGAYMSNGHKVLMNMVEFGAGPYYIPNLNINGEAWYTNNVIGGAMRGFGANQVAFALETQIDEIAHRLNIDPFCIRRINALDVGLPTSANHVLGEGEVAIKETINAAETAYKSIRVPKSSDKKKFGVGIASGVKSVGFGRQLEESAGAVIELDKEGTVTIKHSQHEMGQGANFALLKLVCEEMGIPQDKVQVVGPDTALTPPTGATTASRQTFLTGNAVLMACRDLKNRLFYRAADILKKDPDKLILYENKILDVDSESEIELEVIIGDCIAVEKRYHAKPTSPFPDGIIPMFGDKSFESRLSQWCYSYCTQVAIVEVDIDTGKVTVLEVISANDLGKVINRPAAEGQIHGSVVQGIGYALSEHFDIEKGINVTKTINQIGLPTASQTPKIISVLVEVPHPDGPNGAKGFAEAPILPTAPAILNAVYDAINVRIRDLPADSSEILRSIRR